MERALDENKSERMSDRTRVDDMGVNEETIPTDDVDDATIGDASPSVDDV